MLWKPFSVGRGPPVRLSMEIHRGDDRDAARTLRRLSLHFRSLGRLGSMRTPHPCYIRAIGIAGSAAKLCPVVCADARQHSRPGLEASPLLLVDWATTRTAG
jgi:hypothetical protein